MTLGPATRLASALTLMTNIPCWLGGVVLSAHLFAAGISFLASTRVCMGLQGGLSPRPLQFQPRRILKQVEATGYLAWLGTLAGHEPCGRARMGLPPDVDDYTYAASVRYGGSDAVAYQRMLDCGEVDDGRESSPSSTAFSRAAQK